MFGEHFPEGGPETTNLNYGLEQLLLRHGYTNDRALVELLVDAVNRIGLQLGASMDAIDEAALLALGADDDEEAHYG